MKYRLNNIPKSIEDGFIGTSQEWFDDDEYFNDLCKDKNQVLEKDSYFNSYSTIYIHEEMIKDKVITLDIQYYFYLKNVKRNY